MIKLKSPRELRLMREAGRIAGRALLAGGKAVKPGVSTADINAVIHEELLRGGALPSFLGYNGFPASACISVNKEVIHGIPSRSVIINEGDLVSIDVGAFKDGYHGDCACTFAAGTPSPKAQLLMDVTRQSFFEGIRQAREGKHVSDIGAAVQEYVERHGFSVVRQFVGHGLGQSLHEEPDVPNYAFGGAGARLVRGMTIAVEPMVNEGGYEVDILENGWTVVTADGPLSAHFEHSVAITDGEPVILTLP